MPSTLEDLNALRQSVGSLPLKRWTKSDEALEEAVAKIKEDIESGGKPVINKPKKEKFTGKKKPPVAAKKKNGSAEAEKNSAEGVTLADICTRIGIDPRAGRRRLRIAKVRPETIGDSRWVFAASAVSEVEEIIKETKK